MLEKLKEKNSARKLEAETKKQQDVWKHLDELMSQMTRNQESNETLIEYLRLREQTGA